MWGIRDVQGVRVLNVHSSQWEGYVPEDETHPALIDFHEGEQTPADAPLSRVQWLRERGPSTGGVQLTTGLYWMEPATFDFEFPGDETIQMVSGAVDVETPDGVIELRDGDLAYFPQGLKTTWRVLEPTLEFFTLLS